MFSYRMLDRLLGKLFGKSQTQGRNVILRCRGIYIIGFTWKDKLPINYFHTQTLVHTCNSRRNHVFGGFKKQLAKVWLRLLLN